jgi:hypothetical protein
MKVKYVLPSVALTLLAGAAYAGAFVSAPISVDHDNRVAQGDQLTARVSDNDVEMIGCGATVRDDGVNPPLHFGFCQATDSEGINAVCITQSAELVDAINTISPYAFIAFAWNENQECISVRHSTQSFYLPDPNMKPKEK